MPETSAPARSRASSLNNDWQDSNMTNDAPDSLDRATIRDEQLTRRALASAALGAGIIAGISASAAQAAPAAPNGAPVVEVCVPAGVLSSEQKGDMIRRITEVVLTTLNLPPDPQRHLFVAMLETADGGFGVDGKVFTPRK
jgi:phenylpyruvate tautomerase PptA (4-oxalocrotonate tautomerase family)